MTDDPPRQLDHRDRASRLRHDLVTPINQILGYTDLLIDDADHHGRAYRSQSLRAIRSMGFETLRTIDEVLLRERDPSTGRPLDLGKLAHDVERHADAIVESCLALSDSSTTAPDRVGFLRDLARVRAAAVLLTEIVRAGCSEETAR